jgi:hypothetical protein
MISLDLTSDAAITPEKVAEVRAALDMERRTGEDRRGPHRTEAGRRAVDRMAPTPSEMDRMNRTANA